MLLHRSVLILCVALVGCQEYNYDGDEHSNYDEESHHPDYSKYYTVDTSAPLLASAKSDPESTGFTSPLDFSSFFSPQHFDLGSASNKEPIKTDAQESQKAGFVNPSDFQTDFGDNKDPFSKDYFEQAQKAEQKNNEGDEDAGYETKPGPNYISYKIKPKTARYNDDSSERYNNENDREDLEEDDETSAENKDAVHKKKKVNYAYNVEHKPYVNNYVPNIDEAKIAALAASAPAPFSPQYYAKYTQNPQPLTPYQKYSFQPAADSYGLKTTFVNNIQSTAAPYNPTYEKLVTPNSYVTQQTENIPSSLKLNANACKKVNKHVSEKDIKTGRFKRQAMDCFVCEDPKTGANYEQCSYSSEPKNDNYFIGTAEKFSQPSPPLNYRFKREAIKENSREASKGIRENKKREAAKKEKKETKEEETEDYVNPYDYVKSQSHKYYSKPDEFESTYYNPKEYGTVEEYRFGPEFFEDGKEDDEEQEKSTSEKLSEALKKDTENCKKIKKNGMTCMICKNEKTGGNYEQCSYTSAPAEKKYAYVRERKFDKDDNPIEDKVVESSDPKEIAEGTENEEKHVPKRRYRPQQQQQSKEHESNNDNRRSRSRFNSKNKDDKKFDEDSYDVPSHFEKTTRQQKPKGLDPKLYGSADSAESSEKETKKIETFDYPELEEYHFKLFPNYNKEESKNEEKRVRVPDRYKSFEAEETKKDVEEVLAEFAKKDRSNCKKAYKKGMTCYLCVDKKGLEHEECMYVSESKPKSSHVAYHEVQKIKSPKRNSAEIEKDGEQSESKIKETEQHKPINVVKRKRVYKKTTTEQPAAATSLKELANESNRNAKIETTPTTLTTPKRVTRRLRRTKNLPKSTEQNDDSSSTNAKIVKRKADDPTIKTPEEFNVGPEEGAFSSETKPVYSETFGATLPKYMVEKTEYEVDFDKFSSHA